MPKTTKTQKGTAMDYLSAPRADGIVVSLLALLGFKAPKGGRLPAGVKYDTLLALNEVFAMSEAHEIVSMTANVISDRQSARRTGGKGRITASPTSVVNAVKSGKLSLDELKSAIAEMEKSS